MTSTTDTRHYIGRSVDGIWFHAVQTDTHDGNGIAERDWYATDLPGATTAVEALAAAHERGLAPRDSTLRREVDSDDPDVAVYYEVR